MQFVDPTNDLAFKKIFGNDQHKNILISFLNAILKFEKEQKIKDLIFIKNEKIPDVLELKNTILDISAVNEKGENFLVEMQVEHESAFSKRSLYYSSRAYSSQIKPGDDYSQLNKVYFIGILDFNAMSTTENLTNHLILEKHLKTHYLKDFEFTFIELPKFKKEASELKTITDKWIYFIKNANNLEIIPDGFDDPDFVNAFEIANQVTWTSGELDVYEKISHKKWSDKHILESALERGFEQGMEKGRKDGEKNKAIAIAKNLLDILDDKTIALKTGLSVNEVSKLRK